MIKKNNEQGELHNIAMLLSSRIKREKFPPSIIDGRWLVVYSIILNGEWYELGYDYYINEPTQDQISNRLFEEVRNGDVGKTLRDILRENKVRQVDG